MKVWSFGVFAGLVSLSLAGYAKSYDFEGSYYLAKGDECAEPVGKEREEYFLEIMSRVQDGKKSYVARLPLAFMLGAPIESKGSFSPTDRNVLTFKFFEDEKKGAQSRSPGVNVEVQVVLNEIKPNHIWAKRFTATLFQQGLKKEVPFEEHLRTTQFIGSQGICLAKLGSNSTN